MKPILYYLRRYKTATQLNLLGLSMALAAFYLFMTQVEYNKTFNHSLKDYQRTYRVECREDSKWYPSLPAPLKELWGQIPHVEETTVNKCGAMPLTIKVGENLFQTGLSFMDKNTLDFWGIHLLPGSNSWKEQPDGYIISDAPETVYITGKEQDDALRHIPPLPDRLCSHTYRQACPSGID